MPTKKTKKVKKKSERYTLKKNWKRVCKGGPLPPSKRSHEDEPRIAPAWQRRPRPWEPGGAEIWHLTCTPEEFISRCCMLWAHGVSNKGIAYSLGINFRDFSHWINETDRPWTFNIDLWGEKQTVKTTFADLCQRMKETFEPVYLTKLKQVIADAELQGDMKTVSSNLKWLMEKTMPRKYGKQENLNITNIPIQIKSTSELDLDLGDI